MMKPVAGYLGWIFAALFAGASVFLYLSYQRAKAETASLAHEYERLVAEVERQAEQNQALAETIQRMAAQLDETQSRMERLNAAAQSLDRAQPDSGQAMLRSLLQLVEAFSTQAAAPGSDADISALEEAARLMSSFLTSSLSQQAGGAGAALTVDLHYGEFIDGLGLPAASEAALRTALAQAIERERSGEAEPVVLDAALGDVLSKEQRDALEAYRLRRVREATGAIVETQLLMFAGGLPAALRARIREAVEEAMMRAVVEEGLPAAPGLESPVFLERYRVAAKAAHAELSQAGSETYRAELERFFSAQERMVDMAESFSGAGGDAAP